MGFLVCHRLLTLLGVGLEIRTQCGFETDHSKVTVDCIEMREHSCSLSIVYTSSTPVQESTGGFVELQHTIDRHIYAVF